MSKGRKPRLVGVHRERIAGKSARSQRIEANEPIPAGKVRCPECKRIVGIRPSDGEMRAHRADGVIPCIGARARYTGKGGAVWYS